MSKGWLSAACCLVAALSATRALAAPVRVTVSAKAPAVDSIGLAITDYLAGAGNDLLKRAAQQPLLRRGPPSLPPPQPPSWLRHWTATLKADLHRSENALSSAPLRIVHLETTQSSEGQRAGRAKVSALRCRVAAAQQLTVSLQWQGPKGDVVVGVDLSCTTGLERRRWARVAVTLDSQGQVLHSLGILVRLPNQSRHYPLRYFPLKGKQQAKIPLLGGGWLLQLDNGRRVAPKVGGLPMLGASHKRTKPQTVRRTLLAVTRGGRDLTVLYSGPIRPMSAEWTGAKHRRVDERRLPTVGAGWPSAIGGIWQTGRQAGSELWLQQVAATSRRDAGIALWTRTASGWRRHPVPIPRTHAEGLWSCRRRSRKLQCTFSAPRIPGAATFRPRRLGRTSRGWSVLR